MRPLYRHERRSGLEPLRECLLLAGSGPVRLPLKEPSDFGVRIDILDIPRVIATNRRRGSEFIKNVFRNIGVIACPVPLELNAQSA